MGRYLSMIAWINMSTLFLFFVASFDGWGPQYRPLHIVFFFASLIVFFVEKLKSRA